MEVNGQVHAPAVCTLCLSFSAAVYHTKFRGLALSVASGARIWEVCTGVILILLIMGNYVLQTWVSLQ